VIIVFQNIFRPRPIKFVEKSRAGAQMLCLSFSPGGYFVAAGSSDSVIRVYSFHTYSPLKICELDRHTVIFFAIKNSYSKFISRVLLKQYVIRI
jgi:WD40 repeat protein